MHRVEVLRSARAGVEAVGLVSDRSFPRHAHDHFGVGLLLFGAHRSWSGIGAVEAGPGQVIMVNPGEMHDGLPVGGAARGWRMLYLDPGMMRRDLEREGIGDPEVARPAVEDPLLAGLFSRTFTALTAGSADGLAVEETLLRTLVRIATRHGVRNPGVSPPPGPVAKALRHLDDAPERPTSLGELAALCGLSRFQLLRGFHREVGATPHAYLLQRRVRLARNMLAKGSRPAEVALAAGFADQSHLTRAFVRQFGVTPGRYRAALG